MSFGCETSWLHKEAQCVGSRWVNKKASWTEFPPAIRNKSDTFRKRTMTGDEKWKANDLAGAEMSSRESWENRIYQVLANRKQGFL